MAVRTIISIDEARSSAIHMAVAVHLLLAHY